MASSETATSADVSHLAGDISKVLANADLNTITPNQVLQKLVEQGRISEETKTAQKKPLKELIAQEWNKLLAANKAASASKKRKRSDSDDFDEEDKGSEKPQSSAADGVANKLLKALSSGERLTAKELVKKTGLAKSEVNSNLYKQKDKLFVLEGKTDTGAPLWRSKSASAQPAKKKQKKAEDSSAEEDEEESEDGSGSGDDGSEDGSDSESDSNSGSDSDGSDESGSGSEGSEEEEDADSKKPASNNANGDASAERLTKLKLLARACNINVNKVLKSSTGTELSVADSIKALETELDSLGEPYSEKHLSKKHISRVKEKYELAAEAAELAQGAIILPDNAKRRTRGRASTAAKDQPDRPKIFDFVDQESDDDGPAKANNNSAHGDDDSEDDDDYDPSKSKSKRSKADSDDDDA